MYCCLSTNGWRRIEIKRLQQQLYLTCDMSAQRTSSAQKLERLQATGLLNRIKSLNLASAIDEDDDEDDEEEAVAPPAPGFSIDGSRVRYPDQTDGPQTPAPVPQLPVFTPVQPVPMQMQSCQSMPPPVSHVTVTRGASSSSGTKPVSSSSVSAPSDLKRLKIKGKTYYLLSLLGQGGSAKVYQVYDPSTHQNLAVKVVDLKAADESVRAGYENEIMLLNRLSHCKRVVKLIDYERIRNPEDGSLKRLFLVMEKGDTDLANVLKQFVEKDSKTETGFSLDPHLIKHYWKEMVKAVQEIHELDVVHSDLKPVNFIIVSGKLKLIDFGIANAIESDCTSVFKDNQIGTINYMAPEALQSRSDVERPFGFPSSKPVIKFNCKADIWSLGCILYNLVYGRPPFGHLQSIFAKVQAICNPKQEIEFPAHDDPHLIDCLKVREKIIASLCAHVFHRSVILSHAEMFGS